MATNEFTGGSEERIGPSCPAQTPKVAREPGEHNMLDGTSISSLHKQELPMVFGRTICSRIFPKRVLCLIFCSRKSMPLLLQIDCAEISVCWQHWSKRMRFASKRWSPSDFAHAQFCSVLHGIHAPRVTQQTTIETTVAMSASGYAQTLRALPPPLYLM